MSRRKRKTSARVVAGLPVIRRHGNVLEPVYEADRLDERWAQRCIGSWRFPGVVAGP